MVSPSIFWVHLDHLDFSQGSDVVRLELGADLERARALRAVSVLLLLLPTHPFLAGEEREIAWREAFVTVDASLEPIEGHDGHAVGLMRQRGFAFHDDGDHATVNAWITFERSGTETRYHGYAVYRFPDGAIKVGRFTGGGDPAGRLAGEFILEAGTGRYQGIAGSGTFVGQGFPPHGDIVLDVSGTYSIAK